MWCTYIVNCNTDKTKIFDDKSIIINRVNREFSLDARHAADIKDVSSTQKLVLETRYAPRIMSFNAPYVAVVTMNEKDEEVLELFKVTRGIAMPIRKVMLFLRFLKSKVIGLYCNSYGVFAVNKQEIWFFTYNELMGGEPVGKKNLVSDVLPLFEKLSEVSRAENKHLVLASKSRAIVWRFDVVDGVSSLDLVAEIQISGDERIKKILVSERRMHLIIQSNKTLYYRHCNQNETIISSFITENPYQMKTPDLQDIQDNCLKDQLTVYLDDNVLILGNDTPSFTLFDLDTLQMTPFTFALPKAAVGRIGSWYYLTGQGTFAIAEKVQDKGLVGVCKSPGYIGTPFDSYTSLCGKYLCLLLYSRNKVTFKRLSIDEISHESKLIRDDRYPETMVLYQGVFEISEKSKKAKRFVELWPNLLVIYNQQGTSSSRCYEIDSKCKVEFAPEKTISLYLPSTDKHIHISGKDPHIVYDFYEVLNNEVEDKKEVLIKWMVDYNEFVDPQSSNQDQNIKFAKFNGMEVVLKIFDRADMFFFEFDVLRLMRHPNIINMLAVSEFHQRKVIVLERMQVNLTSIIEKRKQNQLSLTPKIILKIAKDILSGLEYLDSFNLNGIGDAIQHNDLKSDNILLMGDKLDKGDYQNILVKISDFGTCIRQSLPTNSNRRNKANSKTDLEYWICHIKDLLNVNASDGIWITFLEQCSNITNISSISNLLNDMMVRTIANNTFSQEIGSEQETKAKLYIREDTSYFIQKDFLSALMKHKIVALQGGSRAGKTSLMKICRKYALIQGFNCLMVTWKPHARIFFEPILTVMRQHFTIKLKTYSDIHKEVFDYLQHITDTISLPASKIWYSIWRLITHYSKYKPSILFIDDIHHVDSTSLKYLSSLMSMKNLYLVVSLTPGCIDLDILGKNIYNYALGEYTLEDVKKLCSHPRLSGYAKDITHITLNPGSVHNLIQLRSIDKVNLSDLLQQCKTIGFERAMWLRLNSHSKEFLCLISCLKTIRYKSESELSLELKQDVKMDPFMPFFLYKFKDEYRFVTKATQIFVYNREENRKEQNHQLLRSKLKGLGSPEYQQEYLEQLLSNFPQFESAEHFSDTCNSIHKVIPNLISKEDQDHYLEKAALWLFNRPGFPKEKLTIAQILLDSKVEYAQQVLMDVACTEAHLLSAICECKMKTYNRLGELVEKILQSDISTIEKQKALSRILFSIDIKEYRPNGQVEQFLELYNKHIDAKEESPFETIWRGMLHSDLKRSELLSMSLTKLLKDDCLDTKIECSIPEHIYALFYLAEYCLSVDMKDWSLYTKILYFARTLATRECFTELICIAGLKIIMSIIMFGNSLFSTRYELRCMMQDVKKSFYSHILPYKQMKRTIDALVTSNLVFCNETEETEPNELRFEILVFKAYAYLVHCEYQKSYEICQKANEYYKESFAEIISPSLLSTFYLTVKGLTQSILLIQNGKLDIERTQVEESLQRSLSRLSSFHPDTVMYYFKMVVNASYHLALMKKEVTSLFEKVIFGPIVSIAALGADFYKTFSHYNYSFDSLDDDILYARTKALFKSMDIKTKYTKPPQSLIEAKSPDWTSDLTVWITQVLVSKASQDKNKCDLKFVMKVLLAISNFKFMFSDENSLDTIRMKDIPFFIQKLFGKGIYCSIHPNCPEYVATSDITFFKNLLVFAIASLFVENKDLLVHISTPKTISDIVMIQFHVSNKPVSLEESYCDGPLPPNLKKRLLPFCEAGIAFNYKEDNKLKILSFSMEFKHAQPILNLGYVGNNDFIKHAIKNVTRTMADNITFNTYANLSCISNSSSITCFLVDGEQVEEQKEGIAKHYKKIKGVNRNSKIILLQNNQAEVCNEYFDGFVDIFNLESSLRNIVNYGVSSSLV